MVLQPKIVAAIGTLQSLHAPTTTVSFLCLLQLLCPGVMSGWEGGAGCAACPPGYDGNGIVCNDINECLTNNGGCSRDPLVSCKFTT
ncbi:hypothetical protein BV898_19948 [Hypsibius exemplaris]|uniref:Uncharacterized protein n=1 Tax=Hypsibius exemplaris TaxID=2072580 RepID=A0A9X6RPE7_HYPEX|nr:hypothetical protein BV898_19948 [Hypsibius exemplaris]